MITTNFLVKKRKISQLDSVPYTGEYNIDTFHFEFDEEWEGLDKTLVLISGGQRYNIALLNDDALMPFETYQIKGDVQIGLFGTDGGYRTLATGWLPLYIEEDSYEVNTEPENLPTPTQWDLYVTEINRLLGLCQASQEQCEEIASQLATDYETYLAEFNQIKDDVEDLKDDTQTIYNNTNQIKSDVIIIKNQIEEDKADIDEKIDGFDNYYTEKLNAFNSNATQKTTAYNNNATSKTNSFNENYTEKVGVIDQKASDFNTNYTEKTNAFNNNASDKTTAFNSNATSKTTDFNSNVTSKTNAFNQNATDKTTAFDNNYTEKLGNINSASSTGVANIQEAEETAIEHIQEEASSYDERLSDLELLATNIDTDTAKGDTVDLEDSLNGKTKNQVIYGTTEQVQTEGRNMLDGENPTGYNQATSTFADDIITASSTNTSVTPYVGWDFDVEENDVIRVNSIIQSANGKISTSLYNGTSWTQFITVNYTDGVSISTITRTIGSGYSKIRIYLYSSSTVPTGASEAKYKNVIVTKNNDDMTYEPYSGLQPCPSPDYPQDIKVVSGNVQVESGNKNIFTGDYSQFTNQGGEGSTYAYFKLPDDGEDYTLTFIAKKDFVGTEGTFLGFTQKRWQ